MKHYYDTTKKNTGITLISLIITILLLLILAAISINMLLTENGMLSKAQESTEETKLSSLKEAIELWETSKNIDLYTDSTYETNDLKDILNQNGYNVSDEDTIFYDNDRGYIIINSGTEKEEIINYNNAKLGTNKMTSASQFKLLVGDYGKNASKIVFEDVITGEHKNVDPSKFWDLTHSSEEPETVIGYLDDQNILHIQSNGIILADTNLYGMFEYYKCSEIHFNGNFDTRNTTTMAYMFLRTYSLTNLDLSSFDTKKVTSMALMFREATSLVSVDLSSFDTSNVTTMNQMFSNCNSLLSLDLSHFNTSKVTNMGTMFNGTHKLAYLDLSSFDTSNVTAMSNMFSHMYSIKILNLSHFNTSKVTTMSQMFIYNFASELILTNFDTSNVTDMWMMFRNTSTTTLDLSSFDMQKVTNTDMMFLNTNKTTTLYARTQYDADVFNASSNKPSTLNVVIKN